MPAVGRWRAEPCSQPSSCQRSRSAMAPAVRLPSARHTRSSRSPCSVSAPITTRVQAEPRAQSRSCSSSARPRARNAAGATVSAGGSSSTLTVRSSGGGREGGRSLVEPAGQAPRRLALGAEAGQHVALGERRHRAEGGEPEAHPHVGELRPLQRRHGPAGQELSRPTRRHHPDRLPRGGRQRGGEDPVGHPHLAGASIRERFGDHRVGPRRRGRRRRRRTGTGPASGTPPGPAR